MGLLDKIIPDRSSDDEELENQDFQENEEGGEVSSKPKAQFVLAKPEQKSELLSIADSLLERKMVILNLELVSNERKSFIDFLSGVAYALNGKVKKVADYTFLIIPGGLDISGNIFEEIEDEIGF